MKKLFVGALVAGSLFATGALAQQAPNTLGKIKAAKVVNVAYAGDSLPFSFAGPDKRPAGYSIDLCKRVIAQIGRAVGIPDLKVNWLAGSTPERLEMVRAGKADLECGNTTQTLARHANVDFSSLIFIAESGLRIRSHVAETRGERCGDGKSRPLFLQGSGPARAHRASASVVFRRITRIAHPLECLGGSDPLAAR